MNHEIQKKLNKHGTVMLRKAAQRLDYYNATWIDTHSNKQDKYRITRRVDKYVYVRWAALGEYPPRGLSTKYTVAEFLKRFKPLTAPRGRR